MKILHTVESYLPTTNGMQQVVQQLSERLVLLGHDVTIATCYNSKRNFNILNGVKIESFRISGKLVTEIVGSKGEIDRYINFVTSSDFDVVANFAAQQWATDLLLDRLDSIKTLKFLIPTGFPDLNNPNYSAYYNSMRTYLFKYNSIIFLSNYSEDYLFAKSIGCSNMTVINNGASLEEFITKDSSNFRKKLGISEDSFLIIHVGSHTGLKGHRELYKIYKGLRIENSTLLVIGNVTFLSGVIKFYLIIFVKLFLNLFNLFTGKYYFYSCFLHCLIKSKLDLFSFQRFKSNKRIIVKNLSRNDTVSAYLCADLFLFTSNIECSPLVMFESMASGTPFISTDVGNVREILEYSNAGTVLPSLRKNGYVFADVDESVELINSIVSDKDLLERFKYNGLKASKEIYNWSRIAGLYDSLYKSFFLKK